MVLLKGLALDQVVAQIGRNGCSLVWNLTVALLCIIVAGRVILVSTARP